MTEHADDRAVVSEHYGRSDLAAMILAALHGVGKDPDNITAQVLAPVDQLHTCGKDATLELARLAGVTPEVRVLASGAGWAAGANPRERD